MFQSKIQITVYILLFVGINCYGQQGQWVWMKGDTSINSWGNFGVQGVLSITNEPPALADANCWTDLTGNFWLYGGSNTNGFYCDLWKYEVLTNMWVWVNGPGITNQLPSYGLQGIPSTTNNPGTIGDVFCTWTDTTGDLWLFGGNNVGHRNTLWRYRIQTNEWTWMKGSIIDFDPGNYGQIGIGAPSNNPPYTFGTSCTWVDDNSNLWFFGGIGPNQCRNDLWKYNIQTNEWTWMKGSNSPNQFSVYGIKGVSSPQNTPGARIVHSRWKDPEGNFILFGGWYAGGFMFNDLWKYNVSTNKWTWISGSNQYDSPTISGNLCDTSINFIPCARYYNTACWVNDCGVLYTFGGNNSDEFTCNDLWSYNPIADNWALIKGNLNSDEPAVFGIKHVPNINNTPGGRSGPCSWSDNQGNFWLFSGKDKNPNNNPNQRNDLWKFIPDPNCPFAVGLGNVTVSNDTTICKGDSIQLFSSGGLYYSWLPDSTINNPNVSSPIVYPSTSTVYSVVISNDGCAKKKQIHVKVLNDTIMKVLNNDTSLCKGQAIQINASGGLQYIWNTTETTPNINVIPLTQTTFIVTITDSNGCRKSDSVTISVNSLPVLQLSPHPASICLGDSVSLNVTGAVSYKWSPLIGLSNTTYNHVSASPLSTTIYQIIGIDSNSCQATDSLLVTVYPLPVISVTPSELSICNGDSVIFNVYGGIDYFWMPTTWLSASINNTMIAVPHQDITYSISGTDMNQCTNSTQAKVTVYTIPITLSDTAILCLGNSLTLNLGAINGCQFIWQDGYNGQTYTVTEPGKYWVTSIMNNCKRIDTVDVLICTDIWVANAFTPGSDGVNDIFLPKASTDLRYYQFRIYDRWGELLFESNDINKGWNGSFKNETCQQDAYVWTIVYEGINQPGKATLKGTVTLLK